MTLGLLLCQETVEDLSYCEIILRDMGYDPEGPLDVFKLIVSRFIDYAESEEEEGNAEN